MHQKNPDFKGWVWAVAEVDLARVADKAERINITLPSRLLARAAMESLAQTSR